MVNLCPSFDEWLTPRREDAFDKENLTNEEINEKYREYKLNYYLSEGDYLYDSRDDR